MENKPPKTTFQTAPFILTLQTVLSEMISGILAVQNGINCSSFCRFDGECARTVASDHVWIYMASSFNAVFSVVILLTSRVYRVVHVVSII